MLRITWKSGGCSVPEPSFVSIPSALDRFAKSFELFESTAVDFSV